MRCLQLTICVSITVSLANCTQTQSHKPSEKPRAKISIENTKPSVAITSQPTEPLPIHPSTQIGKTKPTLGVSVEQQTTGQTKADGDIQGRGLTTTPKAKEVLIEKPPGGEVSVDVEIPLAPPTLRVVPEPSPMRAATKSVVRQVAPASLVVPQLQPLSPSPLVQQSIVTPVTESRPSRALDPKPCFNDTGLFELPLHLQKNLKALLCFDSNDNQDRCQWNSQKHSCFSQDTETKAQPCRYRYETISSTPFLPRDCSLVYSHHKATEKSKGQPIQFETINSESPRRDLKGLVLIGTFHLKWETARLDGIIADNAILTGSSFKDSDIIHGTFIEAVATAVDLSTTSASRMEQVDFTDAILTDVNLTSRVIAKPTDGDGDKTVSQPLFGARFDGADLSSVVAEDVRFDHVTFHKAVSGNGPKLAFANFRGAQFSIASIDSADFYNANLKESVFRKSHIKQSNFSLSLLCGARFEGETTNENNNYSFAFCDRGTTVCSSLAGMTAKTPEEHYYNGFVSVIKSPLSALYLYNCDELPWPPPGIPKTVDVSDVSIKGVSTADNFESTFQIALASDEGGRVGNYGRVDGYPCTPSLDFLTVKRLATTNHLIAFYRDEDGELRPKYFRRDRDLKSKPIRNDVAVALARFGTGVVELRPAGSSAEYPRQSTDGKLYIRTINKSSADRCITQPLSTETAFNGLSQTTDNPTDSAPVNPFIDGKIDDRREFYYSEFRREPQFAIGGDELCGSGQANDVFRAMGMESAEQCQRFVFGRAVTENDKSKYLELLSSAVFDVSLASVVSVRANHQTTRKPASDETVVTQAKSQSKTVKLDNSTGDDKSSILQKCIQRNSSLHRSLGQALGGW